MELHRVGLEEAKAPMNIPLTSALTASGRPADLAAWLTALFIPRWIERTCPPGWRAYVDEISLADGTPMIGNVCSTMVTGRLVYTFSVAHQFDRSPASLAAAERGLEFLTDACRVSPGRFAHLVDADGRVIDAEGDLYDLAFVLLALGAYAAATQKRAVLAIAAEIADRLDAELADPLGGYREPQSGGGRRRQFPQMHLFEAFQLLAGLDPSGGWTKRADRILDLVAHLIGEGDGVDEWYEADWRPLDATQREREIGHHFEWAWLLYNHAATTGSIRAAELGDRLYRFGLRAADAASLRSLVPNRVDAAGRAAAGPRPLWPTTELLRASIAAEALGPNFDCVPLIDFALDVIFNHAMDARTGLWLNEIDENARPTTDIIPTRVLYHIVPCFIAYVNRDARLKRANHWPMPAGG